MKKLIGIIAFQLVIALPIMNATANTAAAPATDPKDVAGVIVQEKRIPILKDGKAGHIQTQTTLVHNKDSGVSEADTKKMGEAILKEEASKPPSDTATLGILSTIGGLVSSGVGMVTSLLTGKPLLGGGIP